MPKGKPWKSFSRRDMMDIAKIVRNCSASAAGKADLSRRLADYFETVNAHFDRQTFSQIIIGKLDVDKRTEMHSNYKEIQDEV